MNLQLRRQAEAERDQEVIQLLREEIRSKDSRMEQLVAHRHPHYPPTERLAILEHRATGWSLAQTARTSLVSPLTIASWMGRLDEEGPAALVRLPQPVNKFPEFIAYVVKRLRTLCPTLGKVEMAQILARAGLHLGPTTVRRTLQATRWSEPRIVLEPTPRIVTARKPDHLRHVDLTTVPTAHSFWVSRLPLAQPQVWQFCWWLALAVDHFSRRTMGFTVHRVLPSSAVVRRFLEGAFRSAGDKPGSLISGQGTQFTGKGFRRRCRRHRIRHRFGALGKYGSLAVIERSIRTLKAECARRLILVPYRLAAFEHELAFQCSWYNGYRPHTWHGATNPDEIYHGQRRACRTPRFEPRTQ